jgi:putative flippase GtrA
MFLRSNGNWCTFNPSVVYAMWYVNRVYSGGMYSYYDLPSVLQLLHIVAPFLGAVAAGLFCNYLFADSPTSWRRRSERFK